MPQRCSYCGKTEKQHAGKPCVDVAGFQRALADITQPYQVRTGCGHIVIRRMREATAGVPFTPETIIEAPNGRPCPDCEVK